MCQIQVQLLCYSAYLLHEQRGMSSLLESEITGKQRSRCSIYTVRRHIV